MEEIQERWNEYCGEMYVKDDHQERNGQPKSTTEQEP
jgi:hypothetical protein